MYCGCLMTGKGRKKQERGKTENVEGEVLRQNEKTQGEEECESVAGEQTQCDFKEACGW